MWFGLRYNKRRCTGGAIHLINLTDLIKNEIVH